jgi:uncharacterized iron-regulated membrane protein
MRKWHRWLAVLFGIFLFWIALTGFGIQLLTLTQGDGDEHEEHQAANAPAGGGAKFALVTPALAHGDDEDEAAPVANPQAAGAPVGFACPEGWSCRPPMPKAENDAHEAEEFVMHLHSGEAFGPLGTFISIASSLALLFFSFSGMWMYLKMWRARRRGAEKKALFWK